MKMKKTFVMLLSLFALSMSALAENADITFLLRDGKKVSFTFAQKPVVALNEANMVVSVDGEKRVSYAYADVLRVTVDAEASTGVENAVAKGTAQHAVFTLSDNTLSASGLCANERIALYATDGKLLVNGQTGPDGSAIISLSSLSAGVYVVRTQSGISYKLFKK